MILAPAFARGQLSQIERKGLEDALFVGNLTEEDLGYEKKVSDDPYRMSFNALALDHPLAAADALMGLHAKGDGTLSQVLGAGCRDVFGDSASTPGEPSGSPVLPAALPERLRRPLVLMIDAVAEANSAVRQATKELTPAQKRELIEGLPQWALGSNAVKLSFVKGPEPDPAHLLSLLQRVDLKAIRLAAWRLSQYLDGQLPTWRALAKSVPFKGSLHFATNGVVVEISGQGDDEHTTRDTNLCIDLGGRNHYTGRYGAGVGYTSVLLDCGGQNSFDVPDLSVGAGVLGIGLAYELGSSTTLDGHSLCFGCGVGGVGAMYRDAGDDRFRSVALTQGFGMFGVGLLVCSGGHSSFEASVYGQGAARTRGLGWLVAQQGRDLFWAGGLPAGSGPAKGLRVSDSQGFAAGYWLSGSLVGGGVGMLTSLGGDNIFRAESGAQAAADSGGVGSLSTSAGHNTFAADADAQGAANHQAAAYLFGQGGTDSYVVQQGFCHGFGSDYSVAFVLAREGNDLFAAKDSRPGAGNANGEGIFLAGGGENTFVGRPGAGFAARGSGSLGLFCELGGGNKYSEGLGDGMARRDESWAVALDSGGGSGDPPDVPVRPDLPKAGSITSPGSAELEDLWARARSGGDLGFAASARLVGIGKPAFQALLDTHLKDHDLVSERLLAFLARGIGADARAMIASKIGGKDDEASREAMRLAEDAPGGEYGAAFVAALKVPATQRVAAEAAGMAGAHEAANDLLPLTASGDKLLAKGALVSLMELGDPSAAGTASALATSSELPIREAAIALLAKQPGTARSTADALWSTHEETKQRIAIRIWGLLGTPDALEKIGGFMTGQNPGVTIEALLALKGRFPDSLKPRLSELRGSPNPLVRSVAMGVLAEG